MRLNKSDYVSYKEYLIDEVDATGYELEKLKSKARINQKVSIIDRDGEYGGYYDSDLYEIYDFHGSSLFIVDESKKLAYFSVEPREYSSIKDLEEEDYELTDESLKNINKYNPDIIIAVEVL